MRASKVDRIFRYVQTTNNRGHHSNDVISD
jgi:hypothetical protein